MKNQKEYYYHFTKFEYLEAIFLKGLIPMNGEYCKLVGDGRTGVCVSLGISGSVVFSARFWYKMMFLFHDQNIVRSYFDNTVFLRFETSNLDKKECIVENFSQIFSKKAITPDCLKVCYLKHVDGQIIIDRFTIMLYMMKTITKPNEMDLDDFPYRALVEKIYTDLQEDLNGFNEKEYQLFDISLNDFMNQKVYESNSIKRR